VAQSAQFVTLGADRLPQVLTVTPGDLVALVGGGGKTSLMLALGRALAASGQRTVLTTTTRIAAYEQALAPAVCPPGDEATLAAALATHSCCLLAQPSGSHKAAGLAPHMPQQLLARPDVDVVVVEADGAAQHPVKAPAQHEPALPHGTTLLIVVAGIDALSAPIAAVAHRPDIVAALTGLAPSDHLSPQALARLLIHPQGGLKSLPPHARAVVFVNKVEAEQQADLASLIAVAVLTGSTATVTRVVAGSLQDEHLPLLVFTRPGSRHHHG
jgi:probable selenium-dependent hydroxylase accessory protein YqeC